MYLYGIGFPEWDVEVVVSTDGNLLARDDSMIGEFLEIPFIG